MFDVSGDEASTTHPRYHIVRAVYSLSSQEAPRCLDLLVIRKSTLCTADDVLTVDLPYPGLHISS